MEFWKRFWEITSQLFRSVFPTNHTVIRVKLENISDYLFEPCQHTKNQYVLLPVVLVWRETPGWIKRSQSTRLTCPLTSRCNKEERGGDSPALLPSTNPLCTMRVGSVQSPGITQRYFELWRLESTPPYRSAVSHQVDFWCWIDCFWSTPGSSGVTVWVCVGWRTAPFLCVVWL